MLSVNGLFPKKTIYFYTMLLAYHHPTVIEAGCDEAGRGCYAGPVFAAAVILPAKFDYPLLNDSKKLSSKQRNELRSAIESEALHYAVASVSAQEIDQINILKASIKAMHLALQQLPTQPEHILVDGNRFYTYRQIAHSCIIKGDGIYKSIAAASVLAKTYRDEYMEKLDADFPHYGWRKNKGYGTLVHRKAIAEYGICEHHRKSFNILDRQLLLW